MSNKPKIFESLETLAPIIPANVYWFDTNNVVLGLNEYTVKAVGGSSPADFIGKTPYEFYPKNIADNMVEHHRKVVETGETFSQEEVIKDLTTGKIRSFNAIIAPLFDDDKKIVGSIGISSEITAEKEAARLKIENKLQQAKIAEQEIFKKDVGKLIHDISTPIGTIQMILGIIKALIPESDRIALVGAVGSIGGITDNLLSKYKNDKDEDQSPQPTPISLLLYQVIEGKKIQPANTQIEFTYDFNGCRFSFINVNQFALKRSITNLINNAVDAMDKKGTIHLGLGKKNGFIEVTIKDDGKGMPKEVLDKLKNDVAVTSGKKDGHGIGFTQICETVKNNHGTINIDSVLNQGTTITISFPEIELPSWIARELHFNQQDTVYILDDDSSIHGAWDAVFQKYKDIISIKHFILGSEAVASINSFSDKSKVFLLADFELLNQNLNGVDVIKQTNVRSILVTSHYADKDVLKLVKDNNIKVLPKQLASEVTIIIDSSTPKENTKKDITNKANIIIADDTKTFIDPLAEYISKECKVKVAKYYDSAVLSDELSKCAGANVFETFYPKSTKFFINEGFKKNMSGFMLTKALHEAGYTKLYLLSGAVFDKGEIPEYLTAILKSNIDEIVKYASELA
ncbi:hypothetical protein GAMM_110055 [Gammaproteobacteria bacterium]